MRPEKIRMIETELYNYESSRERLLFLRSAVCGPPGQQIFGTPRPQGFVGNPTETKGSRLAEDPEIQHLTRTIQAIDRALSKLFPPHRYYFKKRYCSDRRCPRNHRLEREIIQKVDSFLFTEEH